MCPAPTDFNFFNHIAAVLARLSIPTVNQQPLLMMSGLALAIAIITKRRTTIGNAFGNHLVYGSMLSAFLLGGKYGGLTGAIGLTIGDILVGYATSAPPTFIAKFIFGFACAFMAHQILHLADARTRKQLYIRTVLAGLFASLVNVLTEPVIRWTFKVYILGLPEPVAYISAVNCAIAMALNALPSIFVASILYVLARNTVFKNRSLLDA